MTSMLLIVAAVFLVAVVEGGNLRFQRQSTTVWPSTNFQDFVYSSPPFPAEAPFRSQQETSGSSDIQAESPAFGQAQRAVTLETIDETNLTPEQVEQLADGLWESFLEVKIMLEAAEESAIPESLRTEYSQTIAAALSETSDISALLTEMVAAAAARSGGHGSSEPSSEEKAELREYFNTLQRWKSVNDDIRKVLTHSSPLPTDAEESPREAATAEDDRVSSWPSTGNVGGGVDVSETGPAESPSAHDHAAADAVLGELLQPEDNDLSNAGGLPSTFESQGEDVTRVPLAEGTLPSTGSHVPQAVEPSLRPDVPLPSHVREDQEQMSEEGGVDDDEENDDDDDEENDDDDEVALPPAVPGSGFLSASGLDPEDPAEKTLLDMGEEGEEIPTPPIEMDVSEDEAPSSNEAIGASFIDIEPLEDAPSGAEEPSGPSLVEIAHPSEPSLPSDNPEASVTEPREDSAPLTEPSTSAFPLLKTEDTTHEPSLPEDHLSHVAADVSGCVAQSASLIALLTITFHLASF